jgi:hypothetical protein
VVARALLHPPGASGSWPSNYSRRNTARDRPWGTGSSARYSRDRGPTRSRWRRRPTSALERWRRPGSRREGSARREPRAGGRRRVGRSRAGLRSSLGGSSVHVASATSIPAVSREVVARIDFISSAPYADDRVLHEGEGRLVDQDLARLGRRLQPGGGVHSVSDRRLVLARNRYLPRGQTDPARELDVRATTGSRKALPHLDRRRGTARSASSSWTCGMPKNATTASPMNFSTVRRGARSRRASPRSSFGAAASVPRGRAAR